MTRVYVDASVLVHSRGSDEALRSACLDALALMENSQLRGEAAVLCIDEVVHVRHRRRGDRAQAVREGQAFAALVALHDVRRSDLDRGLELFAAQPSLEVRDAIHAAVAERLGLDVILTTDAGFDDLPGLRRVDPRDEGRMRELTG